MRFGRLAAQFVSGLCLALLAACSGGHQPSSDAEVQVGKPAYGALTQSESARFDGLVMPAVIFPDAALRQLYQFDVLSTEPDRRSYVFRLRPQPGLQAGRDFQVLTITWARAGTLVARTDALPVLTSTGGPQGSSMRLTTRTNDGSFDLGIAEAMLLPNTAKAANPDLKALASTLLQRYDESRAQK